MAKTMYQCEKCGKISPDWDVISACEDSHQVIDGVIHYHELAEPDRDSLVTALYSEGAILPERILLKSPKRKDGLNVYVHPDSHYYEYDVVEYQLVPTKKAVLEVDRAQRSINACALQWIEERLAEKEGN